MPVPITYASGPSGEALRDFADALDAAERARDAQSKEALYNLLYNYLEEDLHRRTPGQLIAYLQARAPWRREGPHEVFKSANQPCVSFMALERGGTLGVLVLGFCHRYPQSEDQWWTHIIRPRLKDYV